MPQKPVTVRTEPNPVHLTPGETMDITITLINNSQEVVRYEIAVTNMKADWFKLERSDMLLYPGEPGNEGTLTLTISLPADASPASYLPSIQVTSNRWSGILATSPINLAIKPPKLAAPDITLEPEVLRTRLGTAIYRVNLKNNQKQPLSVRLYVEHEQRNVQSNLIPPVIRLAPNSSGFTMLKIQPQRRNWIRADKIYKFRLAADDTPVEVIGTLRQSAALPQVRAIISSLGWSLILVMLPLILSGLLITFVLWPRQATNIRPNFFTGPVSCVQNSSKVTASLMMQGDKSIIEIDLGKIIDPPPNPDAEEAFKPILGFSRKSLLQTDEVNNTIIRISTNDVTRLPGIFSSLISVSPNGRYVAYVTARNQLMDDTIINIYDTETRKQRAVDRINSGFWPSHPIFNGDGSRLVYTKKVDSQLELFGLDTTSATTEPRQLTKQPNFLTPDLYYGDNAPGPVCFATDGNQVVVATPNSPTQTQVDFNTGLNSPPFTNQHSQTALEPITNIRQPAPAPLNRGECFVPTFSLNALEWRDQQMKSRNDKIGEAGCPLTAAAMVMNYYKVDKLLPNVKTAKEQNTSGKFAKS